MSEERHGGPRALLCFTCKQPVKYLDQDPIEQAHGDGWLRSSARVLSECANCGTVRARVRFEFELDEGDHPKRSLR